MRYFPKRSLEHVFVEFINGIQGNNTKTHRRNSVSIGTILSDYVVTYHVKECSYFVPTTSCIIHYTLP